MITECVKLTLFVHYSAIMCETVQNRTHVTVVHYWKIVCRLSTGLNIDGLKSDQVCWGTEWNRYGTSVSRGFFLLKTASECTPSYHFGDKNDFFLDKGPTPPPHPPPRRLQRLAPFLLKL